MNNAKLNKVLLYIIAGLVFIIIVGSIFGLISKKKNNSPEVLMSEGKLENLVEPIDTDEVAYYELGRMRIIPKLDKEDEIQTVMVISPWLSYPAGDTVLYEEIARKSGVIKGCFITYFSSLTKNEILSLTEEKIINELIVEINSLLSLGKINNIYYTDYLFLE